MSEWWPGQGHHETNHMPCRVGTLSTPGNIFLGKPSSPGLPATGRDPRPVTASGPPAHRCMGACCTLVAAADSSLRTRLRPLLAALPSTADGRRDEHGHVLPIGSLSHYSAKPQLSWPGRSGPSERMRASHRAYCIPAQTATSTMRSMVRGAGRDSKPAASASEWRGASSSARSTRKSSEVI